MMQLTTNRQIKSMLLQKTIVSQNQLSLKLHETPIFMIEVLICI